MTTNSQKKAVENHRARLSSQGLVRFEVTARDIDRGLIRSVARTLAKGGQAADQLRSTVSQAIASDGATKGGIVAALRRSPFVGVEIDIKRSTEDARRVEF
ncbi:hypothetical protein BH09PSE6_BH09PSE6_28310 [soil metagenome]